MVNSVLDGNRLALSRLLTQVENGTPAGRTALSELFPHTGKAHLIGVTGAPGTGKSSLVNRLAYHYRNPPEGTVPRRVAVVAVDPSSPFSGGAVLGDRVRMRDLAGDAGVFIRSMASRGSLGGLARATAGLVQVFDAAGFDIVMIETVGAGQAEVDIARLAHTTLVVEAPGLGDDIQAIKAGILEIADVLVINKADRPGVESTERALRGMLSLAHPAKRVYRHHGTLETVPDHVPQQDEKGETWVPPIQRTIATENIGLNDLVDHISNHSEFLVVSGELQNRDRARLQADLELLVQETLVSNWRSALNGSHYSETLDALFERRISPWEAVRKLIGNGGAG